MAITPVDIAGGTNPNSPLADLDTNKYQFSNFSYPLDLFTNPELKHYVVFYINETYNTQFPTGSFQSNGFQQNNPQGAQSTLQSNNSQFTNQTTVSDNKTTNRTSTAIALYMPPSIITNDGADWSEEELGLAGKIAKGISEGKYAGQSWLDIIETGLGDLTTGLGAELVRDLGSLTGLNLSGVMGSKYRVAFNPQKEVLFKGQKFRTYSFSFSLSPRSEKEAQAVANIIRAFRFYAAPEITQNQKDFTAEGVGQATTTVLVGSRYFIYPAEFDIKFFSFGKPNTFLNKISTCALTNISVDYTGGNKGWTSFRESITSNPNTNGVPVTTTITLDFMELEIMTKLRVLQGF